MRVELRAFLCAGGLAMSVIGCTRSGPEVGYVEGIVRMDGAPLPYATVQFLPEHGRPSIGSTDKSGRYQLMYSKDRPGALIGRHVALVSTVREDPFTDRDGNVVPASVETVHRRYNLDARGNPEMSVEVKAGKNSIDLIVKSK